MKTNFDGIKKTAEKNFLDEIETSQEKVHWYHYLLIVGLVAVGYALAVLITLA
jgi:hypothetical protein